jgi:hypothetical protein
MDYKKFSVLEKRNDYELKQLIPEEFVKRFVISRGHDRVQLRTTTWRRTFNSKKLRKQLEKEKRIQFLNEHLDPDEKMMEE